ncbi:MAG: hypothetical protein OEV37_00260 [Candidatus Berkelbacteria bacterium]|nr:hypothetical protein [Candidatus Berkelbacteria bacterium]
MLIELSKLENMPVGALDEVAYVGKVRRAVVNPNEIKLIGLTVWVGTLFPRMYAVSLHDIVDIDKGGVVVNSRENLLGVGEVVRIAEIVKHRFSLIGLKARSRKGQGFGRVQDAVADTTTGEILRIYVKKLLGDSRVFERSQIEKITWRETVLKCEPEEKTKEKVVVPEAELA